MTKFISTSLVTILSLLTAQIVVSGCLQSNEPSPISNNGNIVDLVGPINEELLYKAFPAWRENAGRYGVKEEVVGQLRKINQKLEIIIFLGTWCSDSRSEVPKFLQVYDTVANSNFSLRMYGVDRSKSEGQGLAERYKIDSVPTFIFLSGGKELGRIIESPQKTVEEDFLAIVTGK